MLMEGMPIETAPWTGDLFATLYDGLLPRQADLLSDAWHERDVAELGSLIHAVEHAPTGRAPAPLLQYLAGAANVGMVRCEVPPNGPRDMIVARAIDAACAMIVGPRMPRRESSGMAVLRGRLVAPGHLNSDDDDGWVLPRTAAQSSFWRAPSEDSLGTSLASAFSSLLRVPREHRADHQLQFVRVPRRHDLPSPAVPTHLRVAFVPSAEEAADLDFAAICHHGEPRLCVCVTTAAEERMIASAPALVRQLANQGVHVAVLPEMCLTHLVAKALSDALCEVAIHSPTPLIVAGSFSSGEVSGQSGLPFNECTVLGPTGQTLWTQRKLNHYRTDAGRRERYGLPSAAGFEGNPHREHFHAGTEMVFADGALGRMAVTICEDFSQTLPWRPALEDFRPDWLFAPVLDGALQAGRWIQRRGWAHAESIGASALIGAPMTLQRRQNPTGAHVGVGMWVCGSRCGNYLVAVADVSQPAPRLVVASADPDDWDEAWVVSRRDFEDTPNISSSRRRCGRSKRDGSRIRPPTPSEIRSARIPAG